MLTSISPSANFSETPTRELTGFATNFLDRSTTQAIQMTRKNIVTNIIFALRVLTLKNRLAMFNPTDQSVSGIVHKIQIYPRLQTGILHCLSHPLSFSLLCQLKHLMIHLLWLFNKIISVHNILEMWQSSTTAVCYKGVTAFPQLCQPSVCLMWYSLLLK